MELFQLYLGNQYYIGFEILIYIKIRIMEVQRSRSKSGHGNSRSHSPSSQVPPSNELYITYLPQDIQEDNIRQIFQDFGNITRIYSKTKEDGFTFAFVNFENQAMATEAMKNLNGAKVGEKFIKVAYSKGKKKNAEENGNYKKSYKGDMDSESNRSDSRQSRDGRGRGRGRGMRGAGRGRGGGFDNRNEESDARKRFGGNQRRDFGRNNQGNGFKDRQERPDRNSDDRKFQRDDRNQNNFRGGQKNFQPRGERKPGTCFKCQEPGHRANQCPNQGSMKPNNRPRQNESKMSEEEGYDY